MTDPMQVDRHGKIERERERETEKEREKVAARLKTVQTGR
jgi:hypothetical protein